MINLDKIFEDAYNPNEYFLEGYTGENCIACGRNRVEVTNKGRKVCEKCKMNQDDGEYEPYL